MGGRDPGPAGLRATAGGRGGSPLPGRAARPAQSPAAGCRCGGTRTGRGSSAGEGNGGSPSPVAAGRCRYRGREGRARPGPARGALSPLSALPSSRRLVTLARGLAPAFLRFAGKRTDFLQFHNVKNPAKSRGGPGPDYYLKNYEDGELRGRGGGRARQRQRGAAGAAAGGCGRRAVLLRLPRAPCAQAGPRRARASAAAGHRAGEPPPRPFLPGRGEPGSSAEPACPLPVDPADAGPREQKAGNGERGFSYSPPPPLPPLPRRVRRLPSLPSPERAAPPAAEGGFAPVPGGDRAPQPRAARARTAPRLSRGSRGAQPFPKEPRRRSAFLRPPQTRGSPPGLAAAGPLGPRLPVPGRGRPPLAPDRSAFVGLSKGHCLAHGFPLLPSSPRLCPPPQRSPAAVKAFTFCGPSFTQRNFVEKSGPRLHPKAFVLRSRIPCPHAGIY